MAGIGTILAFAGGGSGGSRKSTETISISKATDQTLVDSLGVANLLDNLAGNDIVMKLADGNHNIGASVATLGKPFNGVFRLEADSVILNPGTNQTSSLTLDDSGYINILSDVDVYIESLKIIVNSSSQQIPFNFSRQSIVIFNNCHFDFSAIQAEATIFSGGTRVLFVGCVFEGSVTQISNIGFESNIELYNCSWVNNRFKNGLAGFGTIAPFVSGEVVDNLLKSDSTGSVLNVPEFHLEAFPVSSITDTTAIVSGRFSKQGTIYWGVYTNGSTEPTIAELITASGTGFLVGGSIAVDAGDEFQLLTDNISTIIAYGTDYDVYFIAEDTLTRNFSAMRFVEFTTSTSLTQLSAPTAGTATVNSESSVTVAVSGIDANATSVGAYYKLNSSGTWIQAATGLATSITEYEFASGLTVDVLHDFAFLAEGDGITYSDSDYSNVVSATPATVVTNLIANGTFDTDTLWAKSSAAFTISGGTANYDDTANSMLTQIDADMNASIQPNTAYTLTFDLTVALGNAYMIIQNAAGSVVYVGWDEQTAGAKSFQFTTPADVLGGGFRFFIGEAQTGGAVTIDNVVLTAD